MVGLLTGFYGVGGGFLMTPWLNLLFNVPYNVAVGTDLTQMAGTATMAKVRQGGAGYVDYKLGLLIFSGSIFGVELGARLVELLKAGGSLRLGSVEYQSTATGHDRGLRSAHGMDCFLGV